MGIRQEEINKLLLDPSFRNWSLNSKKEDFDKWENILEDDCKLNQLAKVTKQVVIQIELAEARQEPEDIASFERLLLKRKNSGIGDSGFDDKTTKTKPRRIGFNHLVRIAAVLSFLIVFSGLLYFTTDKNIE